MGTPEQEGLKNGFEMFMCMGLRDFESFTMIFSFQTLKAKKNTVFSRPSLEIFTFSCHCDMILYLGCVHWSNKVWIYAVTFDQFIPDSLIHFFMGLI